MLRRVPGVCCMGPRILLQSTLSSSVTSFLKGLITWDKNFSFQVSAFVSFIIRLDPQRLCFFGGDRTSFSWGLRRTLCLWLPWPNQASLLFPSHVLLHQCQDSTDRGSPGRIWHKREPTAQPSADASGFLKMAHVLLQVGWDVLGKRKAQPIQKYPPSPAPLDAGEEVT